MYRVSLLITFCALASGADEMLPGFPTGDIANGQDATPHSAPNIVSLKNSTEHFCAGNIISESIIVTAAHCLENLIIYAVAGLHNRRDETGALERQVLPNQTIKHPDFKYMDPYDIGLIKIDPPFDLNANIKKVQLPTAATKTSDEVTVFGWGKIDHRPIPDILQTVATKVIDNEKCDSQYQLTIYPQHVCTQLDISPNAIGIGDSGGPLVQYAEGGKTILVGIASLAAMKDMDYIPNTEIPSVFVRTLTYIDWINENSKRLMNPPK